MSATGSVYFDVLDTHYLLLFLRSGRARLAGPTLDILLNHKIHSLKSCTSRVYYNRLYVKSCISRSSQ